MVKKMDEDFDTLREIQEIKKSKKRSFGSIINKQKLSKFELDEAMLGEC